MKSVRLAQKYLSATYFTELKVTCMGATSTVSLDDFKRSIPGFKEVLYPYLYGDNLASVSTINKPGHLDQVSRLVANDIVVPRDLIARNELYHWWTSTDNMLADLGTKFYTKKVRNVLVPRLRGIKALMPTKVRKRFQGE